MKKLQDLKEEILNNKINNFYIFYGEDYGLRQHYIKAISNKYAKVVFIDNYLDFSNQAGSTLFSANYLYLLYNCFDFCNLTVEQITKFKQKILNNCVILDFENAQEDTILFDPKYEFSNDITYFPLVSDNIGVEFVLSEVKLNLNDAKELAYNCYNNYNNILLETNKIKNYAEAKNINLTQAFESLNINNQLIKRLDLYNNDLLVNDLLTNNTKNFNYWDDLIKNQTIKDTTNKYNKFLYNLPKTINDFLIAYILKYYGKYEGSSIAYNNKLSWNRTKQIRELNIPYNADDLLYFIYELCDLNYKVYSGKLKEENAFSYFIYTIL